jgi:hypothetical protein
MRTGEPLYVDAKIRPAWYWTWRRVRLFLIIVWRRYEASRIDWRTAWAVSRVAKGLTRNAELDRKEKRDASRA